MDLEIITQSQTQTNTIRYHLHVESKAWHKWTYLQNRNRLTDTENELTVTKENGRVAIVQLLSDVQLFKISWTAACQAFPSFTISWSLLKLKSIESVMLSNIIQPAHPLSPPSPPAPNPSRHQGLFQWVSSSHEVAKVLEFQLQHQSMPPWS